MDATNTQPPLMDIVLYFFSRTQKRLYSVIINYNDVQSYQPIY